MAHDSGAAAATLAVAVPATGAVGPKSSEGPQCMEMDAASPNVAAAPATRLYSITAALASK